MSRMQRFKVTNFAGAFFRTAFLREVGTFDERSEPCTKTSSLETGKQGFRAVGV